MKVALCYENVLPARGGCETYITDLARRLTTDGHEVHVFASRWDASALPATILFHRLPVFHGPRFLRPWRFAAACARALAEFPDLVSLGFDKTWGQDVLYPQGGLHAASADHNLLKYSNLGVRTVVRAMKALDPAHRSFLRLEKQQYLHGNALIVAISEMVARHFQYYYGLPSERIRLVRCAVDPDRFDERDRPRRRHEWRERFGIRPEETVGLFMAMNYRLKGIEPLLYTVRLLPSDRPFRLLVVGHPKTSRWQTLAADLEINHRVCFAGFCDDAKDAYFASDFLIHPTFYDPCSLVVLEALTCGLPVITSAYNGASELLEPPREGYVVTDPHDHEQLAWCIEQLLDPSRRTRCAQAARRTAAAWTFDHHYQQLLQVLKEANNRRASLAG
ncbi:MAG: WabG protei [Gemmatales bacterium]|nr:MAG: WabG protei [Gemmatales bacterium]